MHTVASNRVSARERELAPRYYYKVAEKTSCGQKIRRFVQVAIMGSATQPPPNCCDQINAGFGDLHVHPSWSDCPDSFLHGGGSLRLPTYRAGQSHGAGSDGSGCK